MTFGVHKNENNKFCNHIIIFVWCVYLIGARPSNNNKENVEDGITKEESEMAINSEESEVKDRVRRKVKITKEVIPVIMVTLITIKNKINEMYDAMVEKDKFDDAAAKKMELFDRCQFCSWKTKMLMKMKQNKAQDKKDLHY